MPCLDAGTVPVGWCSQLERKNARVQVRTNTKGKGRMKGRTKILLEIIVHVQTDFG